MSDTVLVKCENVSKKFCRDLKRSLLYGFQDIYAELNPFRIFGASFNSGGPPRLRKDEFWAVNDINFELKRGECLGLIGYNGAGKSTLLKMLNGLIKPDKGKITIKSRIGALIELNTGFNPILTGRENVYIYGTILGFSKKEIDHKYEEIVEFAEMGDFMETPLRSYSSGMKVRLGFAVAAQMDPDVLLIDEVLAVGDVGFRAKCYSVISEMLKNTAVIFVSHSMPEIARLCNRVMVLKSGQHAYSGEDVSKGIDDYFQAHEAPKSVEFCTQDGAFIRIRIKNNDKNSRTPIIRFKEDLYISIQASVNPTINDPIFHIAILNHSLQNVCHCASNYETNDLRCDNGIYNVKVTIPSLALRPGKYYADFAITEKDNVRIIARTHLSHEFQIKGSLPGYGTVLSEGKWENATCEER